MANTLPTGSTSITDPNDPTRQMKVNADGSINTSGGGGGGGGAVTIADGADVALGATTDINTVASVMGRLTKIRDLLLATLTVAGTITEANSAASKADLDTIVTNTNKIPSSPATEGGNLATIVSQTLTPNVSDRWARQLGQTDIARVLGAAMSATNPMLTQDQIRALTIAGNIYRASTGKLTSPASGNVGMSVFMPAASNKNLLILRTLMIASGSTQNIIVNEQTTDPALGTTPTIVNQKRGGSATVAAVSFTNTTVSVAGSAFDTGTISGNTSYEAFPSPMCYFVPAGTAGGITLYFTPGSAIVWGVDMSWAEF